MGVLLVAGAKARYIVLITVLSITTVLAAFVGRLVNSYQAARIRALVNPTAADADDLYQETTVRLWEQFPDYDPEQEFGAWACTIAYYMVLAHRKKSSREKGRFSQAFVNAVARMPIK